MLPATAICLGFFALAMINSVPVYVIGQGEFFKVKILFQIEAVKNANNRVRSPCARGSIAWRRRCGGLFGPFCITCFRFSSFRIVSAFWRMGLMNFTMSSANCFHIAVTDSTILNASSKRLTTTFADQLHQQEKVFDIVGLGRTRRGGPASVLAFITFFRISSSSSER